MRADDKLCCRNILTHFSDKNLQLLTSHLRESMKTTTSGMNDDAGSVDRSNHGVRVHFSRLWETAHAAGFCSNYSYKFNFCYAQKLTQAQR